MKKSPKSIPSKMAAAKIARGVDLVSYQDGSVVSREILKKNSGIVTLFAFDEGERLSEHTSPFEALVHVLEGEVEVMISGKSMRLTEGDLVVLPANKPHALTAIKKFKMILTMIRS